ncbi:MAG: response regulator transcription factor [Mariniphaga sp.]
MDTIYKIVIADTQFLVVEALRCLITADQRYLLTGIATTQNNLHHLLTKSHNDLLITDIANINYNDIDDLKSIRVKYPKMSILIIANTISKFEISELTKMGIKNIIYKMSGKEEVLNAIESSLKGKKYYSDEILDLLIDLGENRSPAEDSKTLTPSEIEIVKLIADGLTTKEIASRKNISHHTVNTHRKNIFRKVEVSNSSELIMLAIKSGWINNIEYYI